MWGNNDTHKLPAGWFNLLLMAGMLAVCLFRVSDPLFLFGILSALLLLWEWSKNMLPFSWMDKMVAGILLYQILGIFLSVEPVSGFLAAKTLFLSAIFYFLLRTKFRSLPKIETFLFVFCILIALLCGVAFITFLLFRSGCAYAELPCLYDFRYLYKPLGYLSNVWGTLLTGFTGIVLLAVHLDGSKKHFGFYLFLLPLLMWNIAVSFSRGVYISFAVLLLLYLAFLAFSRISKAQKKGIWAALLLPLLISGFIHRQDVFKTLQLNKTLSQQRSIEGRIEAMSYSYELLRASPFTGTGAGTYSQVINEYRYEDDNSSFTNFAPNGYTQLLVEQGILGFTAWGALFATVFVAVFKKRKDSSIAVVTGIVLAAVLIREATFPVLLESGGLQLSIFTVLAIFQNTLPDRKPRQMSKYFRYFPVAALSAALLICAYSIYYSMNEQNNQRALSAMEAGKPEEAEKYISKTSERTPYLINRSLIYQALYKSTRDTSLLNSAESCLRKAALKNPHDVMISYYLSSVLREKGDKEQAISILAELAQKFPNKSLYQLAAFDVLYQRGEPEQALPRLAQAVELSPALLDSPYLKNILSKDSSLSELLKINLIHDISAEKSAKKSAEKFTVDPIFLARSGKILLSFAREAEAEQRLEKAILLLPNLAYPYYYLSRIKNSQNHSKQSKIYLKQFVLLYFNILSKDMIDRTIYSGKIEKLLSSKNYFTDNSYTAKFQSWYHTVIIMNQ
ncbi:MAG: O-antigen ligase family protein [Prevotellaceae bacterium]|jgi:O-antigen ligase/tetratricopeptide (TPR) repeat protein|nr:O-antigen ligase family protein [Prevotellaceae bacterium]